MSRDPSPSELATATLTAASSVAGASGWIVAALGESAQAARAFPEGAVVVVGRGSGADLRLEDASISREHVRLSLGDRVIARDLGSRNGTTLGAERLAPQVDVELPHGALLGAGRVTLLVQRARAQGPAPSFGPPPTQRTSTPAHLVRTAALDRLLGLLDRVADADLPVLLLGETGVGKEVVAELLHQRSRRSARPFARLHCAAIAPSLFEAELFGHERGAFTGADRARAGLLESAEGGTVLLDEIGELPEPVQVKLLRVLEDRRVLRVGARTARAVDVRFVAATNRDLEQAVASGAFRRDLYHRLAGLVLRIPALREQPSDLIALADGLLAGRAALGPSARAAIAAHDWPGNVRELKLALERAALLAAGGTVQAEHLGLTARGSAPRFEGAPPGAAITEAERVSAALAQSAGNQTEAAKLLGISRRTLLNRLDELGLPRPRKR